MAANTNNSSTMARKSKIDKYDFNPEDNIQRRFKLFRLIKEGHLVKEAIRIGTHTVNEEREEGPCAGSYANYQECLITHDFKLSKCLDMQRLITKCEKSSGLLDQSVKNAIDILETRKVNEWKKNEAKGKDAK